MTSPADEPETDDEFERFRQERLERTGKLPAEKKPDDAFFGSS